MRRTKDDSDCFLPGRDTEDHELTRPTVRRADPGYTREIRHLNGEIERLRMIIANMTKTIDYQKMQLRAHRTTKAPKPTTVTLPDPWLHARTIKRLGEVKAIMGVTSAEWADMTAQPLKRTEPIMSRRREFAWRMRAADKDGKRISFPQIARAMDLPSHSTVINMVEMYERRNAQRILEEQAA